MPPPSIFSPTVIAARRLSIPFIDEARSYQYNLKLVLSSNLEHETGFHVPVIML
jgi:hypothetical protein